MAIRRGTARTAPATGRCWLMKTEPDVFSYDDLVARPDSTAGWDGVRNYQARNFMRDMQIGDRVLIYHSNAEPPGVAGIAEVVKTAHPDPTAFDPRDPHHDPRSTRDAPVWDQVSVRAVARFDRFVSLDELRATPALAGMRLLARGNRLSVLPVADAEFRAIVGLSRKKR